MFCEKPLQVVIGLMGERAETTVASRTPDLASKEMLGTAD